MSGLTIVPSGPLVPAWFTLALGYLGTVEIPGPTHEPLIEWFHAATDGGAVADEVPWCSSFLCRMFEQQGIAHTRSKGSQSWRNWGTGVGPILGAVAVFSWGGGRGHCGLVAGRLLSGRVPILGGNQDNAVSVKGFRTDRIVGYRWPRAPLIDEPGAAGATR